MAQDAHPNIFISSTHDDLVEYRQAVRDVLLELGFHPVMMEYFPAMDTLAVKGCMDKVDSAAVYVGIFAHRYGYCPDGSDV
jgi:hypothetical protein